MSVDVVRCGVPKDTADFNTVRTYTCSTKTEASVASGSHGDEYEDGRLVACCAVQSSLI
jgi:hypothetical protein